MKILFVSPEFPDTFWGFKYALKFIAKKAAFPPLGLLTVAALLPDQWEKRLIDLNIESLCDEDILWADYLFVGAMHVQKESAKSVISRSRKLRVKIVAGGPLFTTEFEKNPEVDHLVLNEAELTLPEFLKDLEKGAPQHRYFSKNWADITETPVPLWNLIDMRKYASMNIQYSRGCPYDCEFCDITVLYGHRPRTKTENQIQAELEALYQHGWRGPVFIVDDNFIGNKRKLKDKTLPAIIEWMESRQYPFSFLTEASLNLADDDKLKDLMVKAGFDTVFIGIESPNENSLAECNKIQNKNRDLLKSVKKIQQAGLQVQGGFILGFDNDNSKTFEELITFIQESGIVTAMVGLLTAIRGTRLYQRLTNENRVKSETLGNNTSLQINFVPKMDEQKLIEGYRKVIRTIYAPKEFYYRVKNFFRVYKPLRNHSKIRIRVSQWKTVIRLGIVLGVLTKGRRHFWNFVLWILFTRPKQMHLALTLAVYGFHFRKTFQEY